jgi:sugar lactone lactonase YvrE
MAIALDVIYLSNEMTSSFFSFLAVIPTLRWNSSGITVASGSLNFPRGIRLDSSNTLYIADFLNNAVKKWSFGAWTGSTVAGYGNGTFSSSPDGLHGPTDLVLDSSGGIYIGDINNYRVQYWASGASSGTTVAGTGRKVRNIFRQTSNMCVKSNFKLSLVRILIVSSNLQRIYGRLMSRLQ